MAAGKASLNRVHHTEDPIILLREAARVTRRHVVIKDHLREGFLAREILRAMDWVGNYGHNVVLPYNYYTLDEWHGLFRDAAQLHFVTRLTLAAEA